MRTKIIGGVAVPYSAEEEAAADAADAAFELAYVDQRREERREVFRKEAGSRISTAFGGKTGEALELAQLNALARMGVILREEIAGVTTNSAELDVLQSLNAQKDAIRSAENVASAELDAAGTDTQMTPAERIAEIDAVVAVWP